MRLIDADVLLNKIAELEAEALEQVANYEPLSDRHPGEWHRWTGILQERTAFKYDLMDAPTIDAEPIRHGRWIFNPKDAIEMMSTLPKCSECGAESPDAGNYCPSCGAKMDQEQEGEQWAD